MEVVIKTKRETYIQAMRKISTKANRSLQSMAKETSGRATFIKEQAMTDKTFWKWIRVYAEAVSELSWVGSIEMPGERADAKRYWIARKNKARAKIKEALDDLVS